MYVVRVFLGVACILRLLYFVLILNSLSSAISYIFTMFLFDHFSVIFRILFLEFFILDCFTEESVYAQYI